MSDKEHNIPEDDPKAQQMRLLVGNSLLAGVILSTAVVLVGVVFMFAEHNTGYICSFSSLSCLLGNGPNSQGFYPTTFAGIVQGLSELRPYAIIELGVILLIATPVVRVITSTAVFIIERDRKFVLITIVVFVILMFSFFAVPYIQLFRA